MHWLIGGLFLVAAIVAALLLGRSEQPIVPACFALAWALLATRDRFARGFLAPNPARDVRAAVVFGVFFAVLLAVPVVLAVMRAL